MATKKISKTKAKKVVKQVKKLPPAAIVAIIILAILVVAAFVIYLKFFQADDEDEVYEIPEGVAEIHYIDIGQGDATLIMVGGKNILIDTGEKSTENENTLRTYLEERNVTDLEYFIITHFDSDHFGNALFVLENYNIKNVMIPDQTKTTKMYENFIAELEKHDEINVICANDVVGDKINVGDLELNMLAPLKNNYKNSNDYSICFVARFGNTKFLFTGDAEETALDDIDKKYAAKDLNCDVFQAGHHGSRNANTKALMDKATPSIIVISCGKDNSYGHPHAEAMALFEATNATIYRTDEIGSIVLETDGEKITKK